MYVYRCIIQYNISSLTLIICPTQLQFPSTHLTYILTDLHIPSIIFAFPTSPPIILISSRHHTPQSSYSQPSPHLDLDSRELAHLHIFQTLQVDINYNPWPWPQETTVTLLSAQLSRNSVARSLNEMPQEISKCSCWRGFSYLM